jgi:hypothetical protein
MGLNPPSKKPWNHAGCLAMILKTILQAPVKWSRLEAIKKLRDLQIRETYRKIEVIANDN